MHLLASAAGQPRPARLQPASRGAGATSYPFSPTNPVAASHSAHSADPVAAPYSLSVTGAGSSLTSDAGPGDIELLGHIDDLRRLRLR